MSHTPPVPEAAQSPFPIEEPPHDAPAAPRVPTDSKKIAKAEKPLANGTMLGVGAAIGIGSAAIVAALLYSRKR